MLENSPCLAVSPPTINEVATSSSIHRNALEFLVREKFPNDEYSREFLNNFPYSLHSAKA